MKFPNRKELFQIAEQKWMINDDDEDENDDEKDGDEKNDNNDDDDNNKWPDDNDNDNAKDENMRMRIMIIMMTMMITSGRPDDMSVWWERREAILREISPETMPRLCLLQTSGDIPC